MPLINIRESELLINLLCTGQHAKQLTKVNCIQDTSYQTPTGDSQAGLASWVSEAKHVAHQPSFILYCTTNL